jgi:CRP/FNR family transcriptional regulator
MNSFNKDPFFKIFPFFKNTPEPLVQHMLSSARYKTLPGNMLVKLEGDKCEDFVLMLSGEKRIFKMGSTDREITLYEIGPGDICVLNASCILSNTRLPANASTTCKTDILLIPAREFLDMIATYAEMRTFVHSHINAGFADIMSLISEVAFGKMDMRLMNYLIEKSTDAKLKKTHHQIAKDLGTSREVVSRLLKDFERQGMVHLSRNSIALNEL